MPNEVYLDYEGDFLEVTEQPILCNSLTTSSEMKNGTRFLNYIKSPTTAVVGDNVIVGDKRGAWCKGVVEKIEGLDVYVKIDLATHVEESPTFGTATFNWSLK